MKAALAVIVLVAAGILLTPFVTYAEMEEVGQARAATEVLNEIMNIPENGIPEALVEKAQGIAVFPEIIKAGFLVGGSYGDGLMVVRTDEGRWSAPIFVTLAGGSIGYQAGVAKTGTALIFKNKESVEAINDGKITLGMEAAVAAGPVGRSAKASTDEQLKAGIYSYSLSKGLFAGISLSGSILQVDDGSNERFYGRKGITPAFIISNRELQPPADAMRFTCTVAKYTDIYMPVCG